MRTKLFTLRYSESLGGFDDTPLVEYTRDKELIAFHEYFFRVHDVPHLTCVLTYQEAVISPEILEQAQSARRNGSSRGGPDRSRQSATSIASGLPENDRTLFNSLREWRSTEAREQGVPPYLIFTNRQLLEIVRARPESPNALLSIPGVGPARVKRYGKALLKIIHGSRPVRPEGPTESAPTYGSEEVPAPRPGAAVGAIVAAAGAGKSSVAG